nr:MbcA/ParS/Xre antitoxin family protein [Pseudomonas aeruginosa]
MDKPAEDQSVTALKGLIKKPENPISVGSMNPIGATMQDRLSQAAVLAEEIFEDKAVAFSWMTTVNDALGGKLRYSFARPRLALARCSGYCMRLNGAV